MKASHERGFTLIELVVVITILGILAAFAVPRFIALDSQARAATVNGLAGSVKSAASLARGLAMATNAAAAGTVTMEGNTVQLINSYPDSTANGIGNALNVNTGAGGDFSFASAAGTATWQKVGAATPANCQVSYTPPAAAGASPTVTVDTSKC